MILFKSIRFKNVLSFGNQWTTINFDSHKTMIIQGENGSGKSTCILDTLSFGLYGRPFRKINKPNLINYKNKKDMVVEIIFSIENDEYKVIRGQNPQVFSIYKNDNLINQDAQSRDYQKYLEKEILKIDFQAFTQIVILGKASYIAFLRLQLADRRKFIENVLNLSIISSMSEIAHKNSSQTKTELQDLKSRINLLKEKISLKSKHLQDFEEEIQRTEVAQKRQTQQYIDTIQSEIDSLQKEKENLCNQITEIIDLSPLKKKQEQIQSLLSKIEVKSSQIKNRIDFFKSNDHCPTCENTIDEGFKKSKVSQFIQKEKEIIEAQDTLSKKYNSLMDEITKIQRMIEQNQSINRKIVTIENTIRQKNDEIIRIRKSEFSIDQTTIDKIKKGKEELNNLQNEREDLIRDRENLSAKISSLEFISSMLKDTGIKATVIKEHIPTIIKIMNQNLKKMGLFVRFDLNENFEESLYARGFDPVPYNGMSEGEKQRIDIALVMTWREICKLQNNMSVNLIVFDEILDGSLDEKGRECLISLFKSLSNEGTRIVVVSHSSEKWNQSFGSSYTVEMKGGFSQMKEKSDHN